MRVDAPMILTRLAAGIGALTIAMAAPVFGAEPRPSETATTCTNVASGANWQIRIDYAKATVDSNPARISDAQISWRDASDGGNYTLDRKSGKLTAILASSTGGSFFYHHCKLEN
jgi:hypothetical protein